MALSADQKMRGIQNWVPGNADKDSITYADTSATDIKPLGNITRRERIMDKDGVDKGWRVEMVFPTETGALTTANMTAWGLDQFAAGSVFLFPKIPATPVVIKVADRNTTPAVANYKTLPGSSLAS